MTQTDAVFPWSMRHLMPSSVSTFERLIAFSKAALAWEAFWRGASALAGIALVFCAVSWFGLWISLPPYWRIAGVLLFAVLAAWSIWRATRGEQMSRRQALQRIDRSANDPHGLATALDDSLANAGSDPATAALWRLHQARLQARLAAVRLSQPSPRAVDRDRHALRAGALLLAIVGGIAAGPERAHRLSAAFDWRGGGIVGAPPRLDAWIDPPPYTGKPPIVLTARTDGIKRFSAPVGSTIVVRASDAAGLDLKFDGGIEPMPATDPPHGKPQQRALEQRFSLKGAGRLTVGRETFELASIPDLPPTIELMEQPRANLRGSMTLNYRTDDDYSVSGAEARFATPEIEGRPTKGRVLVPAPVVPLALPPGPNGAGDGRSTADLSESPWAGARATLTLHARDEGGNQSATAPLALYLPQRNFTNPVARALVEQRRNLALEPDGKLRVSAAIQALMIAPEQFSTSAAVYLGLSSAVARLSSARNDEDLRGVVDFLWSMALQIEDGGRSDAEREMRAAEQQLRDALQRGASEEEIRKLTDALRSAMDKFLAEMMRRQPEGDQQAQRSPERNARNVTRDDLRKMLDQLQEMARNGDTAEAQRMLDQLQNMLENLRTAQRRNPGDKSGREMRQALGDMDRLMRDQQQLRDDTYRDGRKQSPQEGQRDRQQPRAGDADRERSGRRSSPGQDQGQNLRDRQQQLRDRLGDLQRRLGQNGAEGQGDMKAAEDAMKDADGELGEGGDRDKAVGAQGRALDAMKKGADRMAQQMQNNGQPSEQAGEGEGQQTGEADGEGPSEADPLGRPSGRDPRYNPRARYDPLGASPALRAQRVLEELRKRLGDVTRPQEELDYLDRLIRRY